MRILLTALIACILLAPVWAKLMEVEPVQFVSPPARAGDGETYLNSSVSYEVETSGPTGTSHEVDKNKSTEVQVTFIRDREAHERIEVRSKDFVVTFRIPKGGVNQGQPSRRIKVRHRFPRAPAASGSVPRQASA